MIDLAELGLTKEEIQDRVIERMCDRLLMTKGTDEDGEACRYASAFSQELNALIQEQIETSVASLAEKHVLPRVAGAVENICLQATNQWGEKVAQPMTFTEYLVSRAEAYLQEKVNYEGKSQKESGGYSWSGTQTRITHLVHQHLHYSIEAAMKQAVSEANKGIANGITEAVKMKLNDIVSTLRCNVEVKK